MSTGSKRPARPCGSAYTEVLRAGRLWQRLIALDPADEQAQCALMQSALDAGNRGRGHPAVQSAERSLRIDLGVGPGAEP